MSKKKHTHITKKRTAHKRPTKPYRYILPDDLQSVQLMAFAATMDIAFHCATGACSCAGRKQGEHLNTQSGIPFLAMDLAKGHMRLDHGGRQGTNDPDMFQQEFARIVPRVYQGALTMFKTIPGAVQTLEGCDAMERWATELAYATSHFDLLKTPGNDPLALD